MAAHLFGQSYILRKHLEKHLLCSYLVNANSGWRLEVNLNKS